MTEVEKEFIAHRDSLRENINNLLELLKHERNMLQELTPENFPIYYLEKGIKGREENIERLLKSLKQAMDEWEIFYTKNYNDSLSQNKHD